MTFTTRIKATAAVFQKAARDSGAIVSADGRVSESVAASLLGISLKRIRRLRYGGELPAFELGVGDGRISYRLEALAAFVESSTTDLAEVFDEVPGSADVQSTDSRSSDSSAVGPARARATVVAFNEASGTVEPARRIGE